MYCTLRICFQLHATRSPLPDLVFAGGGVHAEGFKFWDEKFVSAAKVLAL